MKNNDVLATSMQKHAGLSQLLTAIPGIGGALHGLIDPVEGSPRGTSLFYEGLGGGLGSLAGGISGSLAFRGDDGAPGIAGLLGGGAAGGAAGSALGRWLADSGEADEMEELRKLVMSLQKGTEGGVTVNIGQAGPTAAAAAGTQTLEL